MTSGTVSKVVDVCVKNAKELTSSISFVNLQLATYWKRSLVAAENDEESS